MRSLTSDHLALLPLLTGSSSAEKLKRLTNMKDKLNEELQKLQQQVRPPLQCHLLHIQHSQDGVCRFCPEAPPLTSGMQVDQLLPVRSTRRLLLLLLRSLGKTLT